MSRVYKICSASQWIACENNGALPPSPVDVRDGYIHMSTAAQVRETARLHFVGQDDLWLLAIDTAVLGDALRWEPSRGGALFPHVYGDLPLGAVRSVTPLPLGLDGRHVWPLHLA